MKRSVPFLAFALCAACTRAIVEPATLVVDDTEGVFDTVAAAPTSERTFFFTNTGDVKTLPLVVTVHGDVSVFHVTDDGCSSEALAAKLNCSITVELRSDAPGEFNGELRVASGLDTASVLLSGKVAPAELELAPVTTSTVSIEQGTSGTLAFTVTNIGGSPSGPVQLFSQSLPFDATDDRCSGVVLAGGESCTLTLHRTIAVDATIGQTASGTLTATATPGGEGTVSPTVVVAASRKLVVSSADWGSVPTIYGPLKTITVSNFQQQASGTMKVTLSDYEFWLQTDNCTGKSLAPGTSCTVDIRAALSKAGAHTTELDVASAFPGKATLTADAYRAHWTFSVTILGTGTIFQDGGYQVFNGTKYPVPNGSTMPTLRATPGPGGTFLGWSGTLGCTGTGDCGGIIGPNNSDLTLIAKFSP